MLLTSQETIGDHHHGDAFAEGGEHEGGARHQRARHAHRSTPKLVA